MRRVAVLVSVAIICILIGVVAAGEFYVRSLGPRARIRLIKAVQDRFDGEVQLKSLTLTLVPQPTVSGEALVVSYHGAPQAHPLLAIQRFTAHANLVDLLRQHDRVDLVRLEGLQIHVPPGGTSAFMRQQPSGRNRSAGNDIAMLRVRIREIIADGALLEVEPKVEGKRPLRFPIPRLTLWSEGAGAPLAFQGEVQNATPPGLIRTSGKFGPWQRDNPRTSQVSGSYTFSNADLSVFRGITGMLSSQGVYSGALEHIEVSGQTDTPDFALKRHGAPVHLRTTFHSVVDGTDGETILNPVQASFLRSTFVCQGGVVKVGDDTHKTVDLKAVAHGARMEDILQLVLGEQQPILAGWVDFSSKILVPPGNSDVLDRLQLDGSFRIRSARFASPNVAHRLQTLSNRARGINASEERDEPQMSVASNFNGRFRLMTGSAEFAQLSFSVPGAEIRLSGGYELRQQQIRMGGVFRMDARLSQTQTGVKSWLLKPFDPLFMKDGAGFEVPLTISGTRKQPVISAYALHHRFTLK